MTDVTILIPVLDRPDRALPVARSIRDTSDAAILFVATEGDDAETRAVLRTSREIRGVALLTIPGPPERGDYARKINEAARVAATPWIFQGADDLRFTPGWLDAVTRAAAGGAQVIGTVDGCNARTARGALSTHSLVSASYVREHGTIDGPGEMLHEGYWHNFVDEELVATARARGVYTHARDALVEHLHPLCGKSDAPIEAGTYGRALDRMHFQADRRLFGRRSLAWRGRRSRTRRGTMRLRDDPRVVPKPPTADE